MKILERINNLFRKECDMADVWDGHTPEDAKERIAKYIRTYQFRDIVEKLNIKTI